MSVIVRSPAASTNVKARRCGSSRVAACNRRPSCSRALTRSAPEVVVPDRDEEVDLSGQVAKLPGRDRPAAGRLLPGRRRGHDLARLGKPFDGREANPLDMADNSGPHISPPISVREDDGSRARSPVRSVLRRASRRGAPRAAPHARSRTGGGRLPGDIPARAACLRTASQRRQPPRLGADDRAPRRRRPAPAARARSRRRPSREPTRAPRTPSSASSPTTCRERSERPSCSATATTFPTPRSAPRSARARTPPARRPRPVSAD